MHIAALKWLESGAQSVVEHLPGVVAPRGKWNDRRHLDEGRVHMRNEVVLSCRA